MLRLWKQNSWINNLIFNISNDTNSHRIVWNLIYVFKTIYLFSKTCIHLNFEQQKSRPYHHLCSFQSFITMSPVTPVGVLRIIQSWRCIQTIYIYVMALSIPPPTIEVLCTATPICVIIMILCGKRHLIMATQLVI